MSNVYLIGAVLGVAVFAGSMPVTQWTAHVTWRENEPGENDVTKRQSPKIPIPGFSGVVTSVDDESITIQDFGLLIGGNVKSDINETRTVTIYTGNPVRYYFLDSLEREHTCAKLVYMKEVVSITTFEGESKVLRRVDQPLRRFQAKGALAKGGYNTVAKGVVTNGDSTYRLADVRVGDEVRIQCEWMDGKDVCVTIRIERRPGGLVPPAPGEQPGEPIPYHTRANEWNQALQDLAEKGIPLPEKFLAPWELEAKRAKIAPPPRVARPRIPPAKQ